MPDLKNVYLYFLSLRKLIFKSIKELFFSTNFYNKLLISAIPSRFFFYPNPYLLSPLLNHKSFLFKISKNDIDNFWNENLKKKEKKNIHSFLWLNLIDRKNEAEIIQKIIRDWISKYGNYKKDIWNDNIINKRIIAWISNSEIILNNVQRILKKYFFNL